MRVKYGEMTKRKKGKNYKQEKVEGIEGKEIERYKGIFLVICLLFKRLINLEIAQEGHVG